MIAALRRINMYFNPDNKDFIDTVNDDIYVDKTDMISIINNKIGKKSSKYICVSRPRRFGKSTDAGMLAAYYSVGCDSKRLFQDYKIAHDENYLKYLNKYPVISFNVQQFTRRANKLEDLPDIIEKEILKELKEVYDRLLADQIHLADALYILYNKTSDCANGFIFILDEWDCVFRIAKNDISAQKNYLDFLRDLFKDRTYAKLVYMTGILPIKKYGTHSALNIFTEFSMTDPSDLSKYVGFTEKDVIDLCQNYQMDYQIVQEWYDGYRFENNVHIYCPKSVIGAMSTRKCRNYWTQTETYEALKCYIEMNFDGLKDDVLLMLGGMEVKVNPYKFQNDMMTFESKDDVITLLIHLGYLAYNQVAGTAYIPNREIASEFLNVMESKEWGEVFRSIQLSKELLESTLNLEMQKVAQMIDDVHSNTTSVLQYHNENALSCVISIAYYAALTYYMPPVRELPTGRGFADIVYIPKKNVNKPALLIELKWNRSARGAIHQIQERMYTSFIGNYTGEILLVGINYDKKTKKHECEIVKAQV